MSFKISKVQSVPFLSKYANQYITKSYSLVVPTDELLSELPLQPNLKIKPFAGVARACLFLDAILDFDVRSDDVFVCSMPKCGSSWVQTIVWLLKHNLDYKTTQTVDTNFLTGTFNRTHGLEKSSEYFDDVNSNASNIALKKAYNNNFNHFESPRVLKSFWPIYFLPKAVWTKASKVIYVVRNPMDMVVSEYHFLRNTYFFNANFTMDDIVNGIVNDTWSISPRSEHVLNYWNASKYLSNIFFVAYEDLVNDSFKTIKQISEFLECDYNNQQLKELTEYVQFDNMKKIKTINRENYVESIEKHMGMKRPDAEFKFLRKGRVGAYRDDLNDHQIQKLNDWARNVEYGSDFKYKI